MSSPAPASPTGPNRTSWVSYPPPVATNGKDRPREGLASFTGGVGVNTKSPCALYRHRNTVTPIGADDVIRSMPLNGSARPAYNSRANRESCAPAGSVIEDAGPTTVPSSCMNWKVTRTDAADGFTRATLLLTDSGLVAASTYVRNAVPVAVAAMLVSLTVVPLFLSERMPRTSGALPA